MEIVEVVEASLVIALFSLFWLYTYLRNRDYTRNIEWLRGMENMWK